MPTRAGTAPLSPARRRASTPPKRGGSPPPKPAQRSVAPTADTSKQVGLVVETDAELQVMVVGSSSGSQPAAHLFPPTPRPTSDKAARTRREQAERHMRVLFDELDADASGRLDKKEIAEMAALLHERIPRTEFELVRIPATCVTTPFACN